MLKRPNFAKLALHITGLLLCILPPAAATACYFPLWTMRGASHTLAGGGVLILVLCAMPLYKYLKRLLASPASYLMWLILFLIFFCLSKIAEEMTVIAFVGFIGNLLGSLCFRMARGRVNDETGI